MDDNHTKPVERFEVKDLMEDVVAVENTNTPPGQCVV
jgi:hypothetical protein